MNNTDNNSLEFHDERQINEATHKLITRYVNNCERVAATEKFNIQDIIRLRIESMKKDGLLNDQNITEKAILVGSQFGTESETETARDERLIKDLNNIASIEHPVLIVDLTGCDGTVEDESKTVNEKGLKLSAEDYVQEIKKYNSPELVVILYREYAAYYQFMELLNTGSIKTAFKGWKSRNELIYFNMIVCEQPATFDFPHELTSTIHTYKAAFLRRPTNKRRK